MGEALPCWSCGRPSADEHTLICSHCLLALPGYDRHCAEHFAIHVALLRQHLMNEEQMGGIRWTEAQLREHLRRAQEPAPKEERKAKDKSFKLNALESRTLAFELPLTPTRNAYDRMHFRAQRRLKDAIAAAMSAQVPLASGIPFERAKVEVVRCSAQEPDPDNQTGSVKPILDAMQVRSKRHPYGACIITDDNREGIELVVRWEKAPPRKGKIIVLVTPK